MQGSGCCVSLWATLKPVCTEFFFLVLYFLKYYFFIWLFKKNNPLFFFSVPLPLLQFYPQDGTARPGWVTPKATGSVPTSPLSRERGNPTGTGATQPGWGAPNRDGGHPTGTGATQLGQGPPNRHGGHPTGMGGTHSLPKNPPRPCVALDLPSRFSLLVPPPPP